MSKRFPRAKWVLPEIVNPPGRICFQIQVPNEKYHIAAFLGALYNLTSAIFWGDDSAHTALEVARVWQDIYDNISRQCVTEFINTYVGMEDDMPFFRQVCENNVCYLEFECCPGEWVRLGNADQIPAATQPGSSAPQPAPGGGHVDYPCTLLQANGQYLVPTVVSTGDVISFTANGSGNDGGEIQWRCADGSTYFAGLCNESETRLDGADPVPTYPHMGIILNIGGTFYSSGVGSFTVPLGISNAQIYLQVNDSDLSNNKGSYSVCVTVTNNQTPMFCYTWDFTLGSGGWHILSGYVGHWNAGTGWESDFDGVHNSITLALDITYPAGVSYDSLSANILNSAVGTWNIGFETSTVTGAAITGTQNINDPSPATRTTIYVQVFGAGTYDIQQITIRGHGSPTLSGGSSC